MSLKKIQIIKTMIVLLCCRIRQKIILKKYNKNQTKKESIL